MTKYIYIISAAIAVLCLSSCQHDEDMPAVTKEGFRIKAYVGESGLSRSVRDDDGFSKADFDDGVDLAGFFSEGGDRNNSNGAFENSMMNFSGGYFINDDMSVDVNRLGKTLLYYPYSKQPYGRQNIRNSKNEVNDILFSVSVGKPDNLDKNALSARFSHLFAMLVIDGGYGFENFYESEVSVTMSEPVETVEFRRDNSELGYYVCLNGEYKDKGTTPDESFATVKGHYDQERGKYYFIVPIDGKIYVKSINAYDNSGRLHKIKCNMWVTLGNRYFLTLEMNELIPTIYHHDIIPWDSGIDLDANAPKGISSESDMIDWIKAYNGGDDVKLLDYGDKVQMTNAQGEPTGESYWRFYLTANIDLSGNKDLETAEHLVNTLKDEFDGCGYTITGLSLKGGNPALFKVIEGEHACVKNLVVDNLVVNATAENAAVGALVTDFKSGVVENCSFTNLSLHAIHSATGSLAGTIIGGDKAKVENCKFSGAIFGTSTVNKIAGTGTVSADVRKGCDVSNVMFGQTSN